MEPTDILLVNPLNRNNRPAYIPYGILYIAAYLRKHGIRVGIFDRNAEVESFAETLARTHPRVVGFSVLTGPTVNDAIALSKQVRASAPDATVVWGGIHSTLFTESCLAEPFIDMTVRGEGEVTARELVSALIDRKDLSNVFGIAFKDGSRIITTPERALIADLDAELPLPAWDLIDMKQYVGPKFYATRVTTFNTSRGCHFRCTFCHNPLSHNRRNWRGFSAGKVFAGMEELKSRYRVNGIYFMEDEFDSNRARVKELAGLLETRPLNIKWHKTTRVNFVTDVEALKREYNVGLRFVEFGVESGSDRMLKFIQKDQTTEQIRHSFRVCREARVKASALFILGLPTETREEFEQTRNFVVELKPHIYMPAFFKPFPGSELYRYCIEHEGLHVPEKLEAIGDLYSMSDSQTFSYSQAPMEEMAQFASYCNTMNLRNEFWQAVKTCNVRFLLQGLEFVMKNKIYRHVFRAVWHKLTGGKRPS